MLGDLVRLSPTQRLLARLLAPFRNPRKRRLRAMADLTVECAAHIAACRVTSLAWTSVPDGHAAIMAHALTSLGLRPDGGFFADWYMLHHRGDFAACRQPADYTRAWLRLKLQQVGEG